MAYGLCDAQCVIIVYFASSLNWIFFLSQLHSCCVSIKEKNKRITKKTQKGYFKSKMLSWRLFIVCLSLCIISTSSMYYTGIFFRNNYFKRPFSLFWLREWLKTFSYLFFCLKDHIHFFSNENGKEKNSYPKNVSPFTKISLEKEEKIGKKYVYIH